MIFVFGSNLAGRHGKGAAKHALDYYGAKYGEGIGHYGDSYAIPTKDYDLKVLPLNIIEEYINEFHDYAWSNSGLEFLLTPVGCGLAGYKQEEILPLFGNLPKNVQLSSEWIIKPKENNLTTKSQTQYIAITGKIAWAKLYTPDEFRGSSKWMANLYPLNETEWKKFHEAGIQKKVKEDTEGKFFPVTRNTSKMIKGKLVHFAPPIIYDKDGKALVHYIDQAGKTIRSYDDGSPRPQRVGDTILIGNGSLVEARLSVYPTAMGPGNRLESIKILDLIHYEAPEIPEGMKEVKGPEKEITNDELTSPPW